ncbi:MAG: orotate phosphoribosyltransferase [Candidatus Heimdallarchaeum aukensis]|uniref:Orotate phosphoribosyltransferase n=1 Tax=Candidatus Heimdallarchaeum aukensis TaxID=2876573 RepID=A0A9Y1FLA8_9ARCH|nr:MAG: orotate phosphoribosyltransferase [Candidatus Heimdallarchaeum aukensis]
MIVNKSELARILVSNNILKFGSFTLKSGAKSWFYVDLRLIPSIPEVFNYVIESYIKKINELDTVDAVAGIAVAGIPFSSVIGYKLNLPSLIVRKQSKDYGLQKMVEGRAKEKAIILLIDDVITTGGSKTPAILALRENNYVVKDLLVLIDRSEGKAEELKKQGVTVHSVAKIEEIFEECLNLSDEDISPNIKEIIRNNFKN